MGELFNLTNANVKLYDGPTRNMDPTFGVAYFDKTRDTGYGGYHYDGRWTPVAETLIKQYQLNAESKVLDIGCGKGFLLKGLLDVCPEMEIRGTEISKYAMENAHPDVKDLIDFGSAEKLDYPDNYFDCVTSINTFHFLSPENCEMALKEMLRVLKHPQKAFIQVDAFVNDVERERLLAWAPIIKSVFSVEEWLALFRKQNYQADFFWTFVRPQTPEKFSVVDV